MLSVREEVKFMLMFISFFPFFGLHMPPFSTAFLSCLWKPRPFLFWRNHIKKNIKHKTKSYKNVVHFHRLYINIYVFQLKEDIPWDTGWTVRFFRMNFWISQLPPEGISRKHCKWFLFHFRWIQFERSYFFQGFDTLPYLYHPRKTIPVVVLGYFQRSRNIFLLSSPGKNPKHNCKNQLSFELQIFQKGVLRWNK